MRNLKIAFRNIIRNRNISLINILGLSAGFASTILILSWVSNELSFDSFFKNKENIYRLNFGGEINGQSTKTYSSPQGVGPEALSVFPEVENFTRIRDLVRKPFKVGDNQFYVDKGLSADSTFFHVFSYEGKLGDLSKSLNRKDVVVLDEYLAEKCFGKENPIGKTLEIDRQTYTVSAVIKNIPENSHLQFHYLTPVMNIQDGWHNNKWEGDNCGQYLVFNTKINKAEFEEKLTQMLYTKTNTWKEYKIRLSLQPLSEIHFSTGYALENAVKGNLQHVTMLITVALLILLIACTNFTNMFISSSLQRIKSTGIKITSGARRLTIIREFSTEVLFYVSIAFIISIGFVNLIIPVIKTLTNISFQVNFFSLNFLLISGTVIVFTMLIAGSFPGYYITRGNPGLVLKAGFKSLPGGKHHIQKSLVTLQFITAILLIISVIFIQKQVNFLKTKNLGFDKENVVYINTTGNFQNIQNINQLKETLTKNPDITGVSTLSCLPTEFENGVFMYTVNHPDHKIHGEQVKVGEGYFDMMKIQFVEGGQDFDYSNDRIEGCVINETTAKQLHLVPPFTGQTIFSVNDNNSLSIKGVIKDINTKSLNSKISPCLYTKATYFSDNGIIIFKLARFNPEALASIEQYCTKNNPSIPFEYHFLNQTYEALYLNEVRTQKIFQWFTLLSILLSCLGLYAMAQFITEARTKEIGIRRVNGARTTEVMAMLNQDFIKWVAIAFIIACPIAWYAMHKWLENFAYKTDLSWWVFAAAGGFALVIALFTVSFQSWRTATRNPVESLRYE
jgi:putative ABC transport system permease protein